MAINYPTSQDNSVSLPNPTGTSTQNNPDHAGLHTDVNAAIIALENKLGTGASTPSSTNLLVSTGTGTSSWSKLAPTGAIVGTTDTQSLTNKTITDATNSISGALLTASSVLTGSLNFAAGATGGVQSFTNTGTAGGTGYYVNLGGIKMLWGLTNQVTSNSTTYSVIFPAFFTTIQVPNIGNGVVSASPTQYVTIGSITTSALTFYAVGGVGSISCSYIIIGT